MVTTTGDRRVEEEACRICERYLPPEDFEAYVAGYPDLRTIVSIDIEWIRSW